MAQTDAHPLEEQTSESPTAAPAKKTRRQIPKSTRRILLIVAGVVVMLASVGGFYYTSESFDERVPVLVAAIDIAAGETISAASLTSSLVVVGSIPHEPWTPTAPLAFEGMVAAQPIPAGALVRRDMVIAPDAEPVGVQFEMVVPLNTSLAVGGVLDGDIVLMVDPGEVPSVDDPGRPRRVIREFQLRNFEGSQMTLFVSPEEQAAWRSLLAQLEADPLVIPIPVGADPEEMAQRVDAVWHKEWSDAVDVLSVVSAVLEERTPAPGELELIVALDASVVPTPVSEGDLVLLVDPGAAPRGNDPGRPRSVLQPLLLQNYENGQMQMFLPPEEWARWQSLPEDLGAVPMIIPVAPGTDLDDMTARLNAEWDRQWRAGLSQEPAAAGESR